MPCNEVPGLECQALGGRYLPSEVDGICKCVCDDGSDSNQSTSSTDNSRSRSTDDSSNDSNGSSQSSSSCLCPELKEACFGAIKKHPGLVEWVGNNECALRSQQLCTDPTFRTSCEDNYGGKFIWTVETEGRAGCACLCEPDGSSSSSWSDSSTSDPCQGELKEKCELVGGTWNKRKGLCTVEGDAPCRALWDNTTEDVAFVQLFDRDDTRCFARCDYGYYKDLKCSDCAVAVPKIGHVDGEPDDKFRVFYECMGHYTCADDCGVVEKDPVTGECRCNCAKTKDGKNCPKSVWDEDAGMRIPIPARDANCWPKWGANYIGPGPYPGIDNPNGPFTDPWGKPVTPPTVIA